MKENGAKVVSIAIRKGGCGKSTTAFNLAASLAHLSKKVLLIDIDPQGSIASFHKLSPDSKSPTHVKKHIRQVLEGDLSISEAVHKTSWGVDTIFADTSLEGYERNMTYEDQNAVKKLIAPVLDRYDYIVIDTPTKKAMLTSSAFIASDGIIIPIMPHILPYETLPGLIKDIMSIKKKFNPALEILGILPTLVSVRSSACNAMLQVLNKEYPSLVYPFQTRFLTCYHESVFDNMPCLIWDKDCEGTNVYLQLAKTIIGE